MTTIDVGKVLDEGRWTTYQKLLIFGTALTIILDGIDNQLLPNAIPKLMEEWSRPRGDFLGALGWGPFGMMIGGLIGGVLGDRIGRRTSLLGSVLTFAVLTLAIAYVPAGNVDMLGLLRFLAGVGLGGAMPNAATLASEYVPRKQRPFAVTMTIICIPLGGVVAAEMAALIIPDYGWRALFQAGGVLPLILAVVLWKVLPESPRYLAARKERWPELTASLRKMGHDVPDDAVYASAAGTPTRSGSAIYYVLVVAGVMALWQLGYVTGPLVYGAVAVAIILLALAIREFSPAYRLDTAGLFGAFFFCLMVNYVIIQLLVVLLTDKEIGGFALAEANRALSISNIGGVAGALFGALLIQQFGSRITMLGGSLIAIGTSVVLAGMGLDPMNAGLLLLLIGVTGALLNGVQTTMYALATNVYPTEIRGTGVGTAVAVGRIGNVLAVYVGNYAIDTGGARGYFLSLAILMGLVLVSLALVQRHIGGGTRVAAGH